MVVSRWPRPLRMSAPSGLRRMAADTPSTVNALLVRLPTVLEHESSSVVFGGDYAILLTLPPCRSSDGWVGHEMNTSSAQPARVADNLVRCPTFCPKAGPGFRSICPS